METENFKLKDLKSFFLFNDPNFFHLAFGNKK